MSRVKPLPVGFANLTGAMPSNRMAAGDDMLDVMRRRIERLGGGVLLCCEADDVAIPHVLSRKTWWWEHRAGHDLDGVLVCGTRNRTRPGDPKWLPGAPASSVNAPRPILKVPVVVDGTWRRTFEVMHYPKPHGGERAAEDMRHHAHDANGDVGAWDGNVPIEVMRRWFPGRAFVGKEVVTISGNGTVRLGRLTAFDVLPGRTDDDHPGLLTTVRPR